MSDSKRIPMDLMLHAFGNGPEKETCATCCNFLTVRYGNKRIFKCRAYGATWSNASDWRKKWPACGMFGKIVQKPVITPEIKRAFSASKKLGRPIDGQMEMGVSDEQQ